MVKPASDQLKRGAGWVGETGDVFGFEWPVGAFEFCVAQFADAQNFLCLQIQASGL
jgi:hypothetical protein